MDGCRVRGSFLTHFAIGEALLTTVGSSLAVVPPSHDTNCFGVSVSMESTKTVPIDGKVDESRSMSGPTVASTSNDQARRRFKSSNSYCVLVRASFSRRNVAFALLKRSSTESAPC